MNVKLRNILFRYTVASIGLFCVAAGIALSIISNMGVSSLSAPAYVMAGIGGLSVGNWTIIVNMTYMLVQLAVLRRRFKLKYLMQIPASVIFGYMIDFSLWCLDSLEPAGLAYKLILIVVSCLVTAFGVSIEVIAQAWMLSAEMTVYAISKTILKPFDTIKILMDSSLVVISMALSWILFSNPFGKGEFSIAGILSGQSENVVVGLGTILMAVLVGLMMKLTDPVVDRIVDRLIAGILRK